MDGDWDWAIPALSRTMQGEQILQPEEVAAMLPLHELGWGTDGRTNSGALATRCLGI
ncbi:hypothetical protein X759_15435 [Mesorhizobium sp. LSHC420B00]|nr:hypothetical protein X759_15435 [Mesorhizobium sp. LSHC420B00]